MYRFIAERTTDSKAFASSKDLGKVKANSELKLISNANGEYFEIAARRVFQKGKKGINPSHQRSPAKSKGGKSESETLRENGRERSISKCAARLLLNSVRARF